MRRGTCMSHRDCRCRRERSLATLHYTSVVLVSKGSEWIFLSVNSFEPFETYQQVGTNLSTRLLPFFDTLFDVLKTVIKVEA